MQRIASRIEKLERHHKPEDGVFFLAWAADQAGIDKALAAARAARTIGRGSIVVSAVWPRETEPQPTTRWVLKHDRIRGAEEDILIEIMVQKVLALDEGAAAFLVGSPTALVDAVGSEISKRDANTRYAKFTDAELYACALGKAAK